MYGPLQRLTLRWKGRAKAAFSIAIISLARLSPRRWAALNMRSLFESGLDHRFPNLISTRRLQFFVFFVALLLASIQLGHAQAGSSPAADATLSHATQVVTIQRNGYTISGLVTHLQSAKTFKYAVALFPGYPGIMRLGGNTANRRLSFEGIFSCALGRTGWTRRR